MPKLVKLEETLADNSLIVEAGSELPADTTNALLPLELFLEHADKLESAGVVLSSDEDVYALEPYLGKITVVACQFDAFADGRSFSQARILRDHLEFSGDVRAVGAFIQDQLHYLLRCGFSEFSVADDTDETLMRESMNDFSESYQAACDNAAPLFRRRA